MPNLRTDLITGYINVSVPRYPDDRLLSLSSLTWKIYLYSSAHLNLTIKLDYLFLAIVLPSKWVVLI
jgi:hypothetical protein